MTIAELGAIGEFVGSIAVLVTLIYLATQIRQNTRSMEDNKKFAMAQAYQARADLGYRSLMDQDSDIAVKIFTPDPHHPLGYSIDFEKLDNLPLSERVDFIKERGAALAVLDNVLYQQELGLLPRDIYESGYQFEGQALLSHQLFEHVGAKIPFPRVQNFVDTYRRAGQSS